ncbi:MAG: hypothetical protein M3P11_04270 [Actinomycetota bacterium]|nr:hypothetical protein [Actinomycetota bacterium]
MPWNPKIAADVRTVNLGEFTRQHAEQIGQQLDAAAVAWWTKEPGAISRIWQLGVEMFVDRAHLEEARTIADAVLAASP